MASPFPPVFIARSSSHVYENFYGINVKFGASVFT
jgi:hypothetical protein